jgi:ubiquinone/menaquinone biosynthesis C-methylase UbiE
MQTVNPDRFRRNLLTYTTRAYELLPAIDKPEILDLGCGTGLPTLELAALGNGTIVGIDKDGRALEILETKIRQQGLEKRVRTINCTIEEMPFPDNSFDIVWAEGSIARLGFSGALKLLHRYLKSSGFLVVHGDAAAYMKKINSIAAANYTLHGFFLLPEIVWWNEFYRHLEVELTTASAAAPPYDLASLLKELESFKREPRRFSSAFFLMKKA